MKARKENDELLVFGIHSVMEAVEQKKPIHKIIIQSGDFNEHTRQVWYDLKDSGIIIQRWPKEKIDKLTRQNHQGIAAFISPVDFTDLDDLLSMIYEKGEMPRLAWLDGVSDNRNLGAIIRSALCFGVHGIILPAKSGAVLSGTVVKTSAGAIYQMPMVLSRNLMDTVNILKGSGLSLAALTERGDAHVQSLSPEKPTCMIIGDEGKGIRRELLHEVEEHYKIDMKAEFDSLNVSVAAAIGFYEWTRSQ